MTRNSIVNVETAEGDVISIKEELIRQSKTLDEMFLNCKPMEMQINLKIPLLTPIVQKIIDWFENHTGNKLLHKRHRKI